MKEKIENIVVKALEEVQETSMLKGTNYNIHIEHSKNEAHGDYATNIALSLAKKVNLSPLELAKKLCDILKQNNLFKDVQIAGPGFINFFVKATEKFEIIKKIHKEKDKFGHNNLGANTKVLLEFVSANPTGPLHVGHGRSAAYGASLCNVLQANGFEVTKQYYVNDSGRQMDILAFSVWLKYLKIYNIDLLFPENGYKGAYIDDIAKELKDAYQDRFLKPVILPVIADFSDDKELHIDALINAARKVLSLEEFLFIREFALNNVLQDIKADLHDFGVDFNEWFSENSLLQNNAIDEGIKALKASAYTYEKEGALWFKSTAFGDEKDRVLVRANGSTTYFAADVAYHWYKYEQKFDKIIDIFGADHHGYQDRIKASVTALGHDANSCIIILVQFAILYRAGDRVQMSTRSGSFVTLRELREEVGKDAARFFYIMRKPDQHMDFDLDLAKSQSSDNPVYYIQYAHARICSVMRQLKEKKLDVNYNLGFEQISLLVEPQEEELLSLLGRYAEVILSAGKLYEPHQIAYYLRELANGLHRYYNAVVLLCEPLELRSARLCLLEAVRQILNNGLNLLGVCAPESM